MSAELLIELRTEELPPGMVQPALDGLRKGVLELLAGVTYGAVRTYATPRRLAVVVESVATHKPLVERLVTGPPADRAFVDGKPSPAAAGFAKGKGLPVEAIQIVDSPKGKVIAVTVKEGGEATRDVLEKGLEALIRAVPFHKTMEWGSGGLRFGRPLQGVAAVFGGDVLQGSLAGIVTGQNTVGHRLAEDATFSFVDEAGYLAGLRSRWVEPDITVRRATIRQQLDDTAAKLGADRIGEDDLLDQVVHLVEAPAPVVCNFEADLLELPPRLLVQSMKVHQRYFPVHRGGELTNQFVAVSNNPGGDDVIMAAGFARVLRARFFDAKFFLAEDKKQRLDRHGDGLARMRWIKGLGTMAQKQARIGAIAGDLLNITGAEAATVARAAELVKCDLLTQMVGEFPELQGHMGRIYAASQGESAAVALAIEEHYHPRYADDSVAQTPAGVALALADRLDTLIGCFGIGMSPKGGGDPQGLRRAALGLVNTLVERQIPANLRNLFGHAVSRFHTSVLASPEGFQAWTKDRGTGPLPSDVEGLVEALVEFTLERWKAKVVADGSSVDLAEAVRVGGEARVLVLHRKLAALRGIAGTADFLPMMSTFKRVLNISRGASAEGAGPLTEAVETRLLSAIEAVEGTVARAAAAGEYSRAVDAMLTLQAPVAAFFDGVLVDAPEPAVKAARMGLLQRVGRTFEQVADFSRITTR